VRGLCRRKIKVKPIDYGVDQSSKKGIPIFWFQARINFYLPDAI
jgi:hypothetical protein